jgi:serine/threonine-protein phosphatase 2B regulatory subunit
MGAFRSLPAPPPSPAEVEFQELANRTHFTLAELTVISSAFTKFASQIIKDQKIDPEEFRIAMAMEKCGFVERIFAAFDRDNSRTIEFSEFAEGLSAISERGTLDQRVDFCFRIYDVDGNGSIDPTELRDVVEMAMRDAPDVHLDEKQLTGMIEATFDKFDANHDGKISLEEFRSGAYDNPKIVTFVAVDIDNFIAKHS